MFQLDPWEKAADCQRALQAAVDSNQRQVLTNVRDLWIALANQLSFLTKAEFEEQIQAINCIQADVIESATISPVVCDLPASFLVSEHRRARAIAHLDPAPRAPEGPTALIRF
jgi:hypothetical protein